jgi:hypothetical protein
MISAAELLRSDHKPHKAPDLDADYPRFRTATPLVVGEDGRVHKGLPRFTLHRHRRGELVDRLITENVAGVKLGREGTVWVNGNFAQAQEGKIAVHLMDRRVVTVPFNHNKDQVIFPTRRHTTHSDRT